MDAKIEKYKRNSNIIHTKLLLFYFYLTLFPFSLHVQTLN